MTQSRQGRLYDEAMPDSHRVRQWSRRMWEWLSHIDTMLGWGGRVASWIVAIGGFAVAFFTSNAFWLIPVFVAILMIAVGIVAARRSPSSQSSSGVVFPTGEVREESPLSDSAFRLTVPIGKKIVRAGSIAILCDALREQLRQGEGLLQGVPPMGDGIRHLARGHSLTSQVDVDSWEINIRSLLAKTHLRLEARFSSDVPGFSIAAAARVETSLSHRLEHRLQMLEKIIKELC